MNKIAYVVKYALSSGVKAVDVSEFKRCGDGRLLGKWGGDGDWCPTSLLEGRDFTLCTHEAERLFDEAKIKKLKSLDKQVKKISRLEFSVK